MTETILDKLTKLAIQKTWSECSAENGNEYFDPNDYAGGNIDDAYEGGKNDGAIELARDLLKLHET